MKKGIILLFTTFIFSFAINVKDTLILTNNTDPTDVKIILNVDDTNEKMDQIVKQTADNIKVLKKYCQKVTYQITPVKNKIAQGYKSHIFAQCVFPNTKTKEFSNTFPKLQGIISIDSICFSIEPKKQEKIIKDLKLKAYKMIKNKEREISKKMKLNCFANNIQIDSITPKVTILQSKLPMSIEKLTTKIKVNYNLECF